MSSESILTELKTKMEGSIENLSKELARRRTGRASVSLFDGIKVEYYGSLTPLNQVASVQAADPRLIAIKPWDKALLSVIEKAIQQSSLGLTPSSDGEIVRVPIPPLTVERRKELVRDVKKVGEDARVAIRGHRRDANDAVKELEKNKEVSEDEMHRILANVQEVTDEFGKKVDAILSAKETEILED